MTQDDLSELETAQRAEWLAAKRATLLAEKIHASLRQGATVEDGALYFDRELGMVRSRKAKEA